MKEQTRTAVVRHASRERVAPYLPPNYSCRAYGADVEIFGHDVAGWTLEGYVIPRLASGLMFAEES
jgi:hypothetical protein